MFSVRVPKGGSNRSAAGCDGRSGLRNGLGSGNVPGVEQNQWISLSVQTVKRLGVLLLAPGVHACSHLSVSGVGTEPVHDQSHDFGFALEVRKVADVRQDNALIGPREETFLLR